MTIPEESPAVYRECRDKMCRAFRLGLPHSHYEYVDLIEVQMHNGQWNDITGSVKPTLETSPVTAWLSLPLEEIAQKVSEYITWVETGMTRDVCKCEWISHPERGDIRGGDTALDCPAHSKEGLVLGFITWLTGSQPKLITDTAMGDG